MFHLHDPTGLAEGVVVSPAAFELMARFFNGSYSVEDMQAEILKATGHLIPSADIEQLSEALDRAGLLESEAFEKRLQALKDEYAASAEREPTHAGSAYPAEPEKLREYLKEIVRTAERSGASAVEGVRALAAPHIDFRRGAETYGFAYAALRDLPPPRTVVILGVGHYVRDHPVVLTEKNFGTPLGTVETDRSLVERLVGACGEEILRDQHEHLREHSVEFQALFVKHLFGDETRILPVLCGAFPMPQAGSGAPEEMPVIRAFIEELKRIVEEGEGDVFVIGGVDFAHVGPRFGGETLDEKFLEEVEKSDRALISRLCDGDPEGFWRLLSEEENRFSVCGYAALYSLLKVMGDVEGTLLRYEQAVEEDGSQAVTFAALAFR